MPDISPIQDKISEALLSDCSDEKLATLARNDCGDAIEILVKRYKAFVRSCSKSYFLMGADREDVIQEGMIGLYKAIQSFREEKDASFKTFAHLCIKRQIQSAVKMSARQKHMPLNNYVSFQQEEGGEMFLDNLGYTGENRSTDPEQIIIEKEDMIVAQGQIDKVLSDFEAKVLMLHLDGVPYGEIAERLGREPKAVDNALQRMKRKIEKQVLR